MKKNFSFSMNTNLSINGNKIFSKKVTDKEDLTPQQEYWLNRFLRDYAGKIVLLFILFFVILFGIIYYSGNIQESRNIEFEVGK